MPASIQSDSAAPCVAVEVNQSSGKSGEPELTRDVAIDFTKGALVLFMVLYHWLNYFIGPGGHYYIYLRFLAPSFIFISGFMISQVHIPRYRTIGRSLAKRLAVRGLKLFTLFVALNMLRVVLLSHASGILVSAWILLQNLSGVLIGARAAAFEGQKGVAFDMLVPIAYLLILAGCVLGVTGREKHGFGCALFVLVSAVLLSNTHGTVNGYLDQLMIGALGVVVGFAGRTQIMASLGHPWVLTLLYGGYLVAITFWSVTLPLQVVSVFLTTALLYIAGSGKATPVVILRFNALLGKYSLMGYVAQIAILQGLVRIPLLSRHGAGASLIGLLLAGLITWMVIGITDTARRKSDAADRLYRLVFA